MSKNAKTAKAAAPAFDIMKKITDIRAEIARVGDVGKNLQHDIHKLACSVLAHTAKHGRIQVLEQFLEAMPDMIRKNSLQMWFETFGQLTFSAAEGSDVKGKTWHIDRSKKVRLGEAMEKPFWKFKALEGAPYKPLEMDSWLEKQVKALEKDAKETGRNHNAIIAALKGYGKGEHATH